MVDDLDSIVKGAPAPGHTPPKAVGTPDAGPGPAFSDAAASSSAPGINNKKLGDPLRHTPSSPAMIYLNLLVLEASLRAQFLELRARRRHHTFFLLLLTAWIVGFGYALFLAPREDGSGVGGSIYWAVEGAEKVCLMGGVITAVLVWATGIFDRGIRWPRRWLAVSNRGLRGFNCKLVVVSRPWWAEALSTVGFFLTYGLFHHTASSSYRPVDAAMLHQVDREMMQNGVAGDAQPQPPLLPVVVEDEERGEHEEDLAPGGDHVKLLLLPKPFSASFRENWEIYRSEYWERENERRALLRRRIKERDLRLAKQKSPWFWWLWLPWRRSPLRDSASASSALAASASAVVAGGGRGDPEKPVHAQHLAVAKERKRRGSSVRRGSTSSSRSQTPSLMGAANGGGENDAPEDRSKPNMGGGASTPSAAAVDKRRKVPSVSVGGKPARRPATESRSVTPDVPSPLARESSFSAEASATPTEVKTPPAPVPVPPRGPSLGACKSSSRTPSGGGKEAQG